MTDERDAALSWSWRDHYVVNDLGERLSDVAETLTFVGLVAYLMGICIFPITEPGPASPGFFHFAITSESVGFGSERETRARSINH